ncbi:ATP-binding cassette domain-containing protein, partial [bacterium]|nr:ATP-binding cassette domain-containing protein [bacterium]
MILAQFSNISFEFHDKPIIHNFSLQFQERCRIGLIGDNGTGKTTLLRLLTGDLQPGKGSILTGKDIRIGHLSQTPDVPKGTDLYTIFRKPFEKLIEIERTLEKLQETMGMENSRDVLDKYDNLQEIFTRSGGYLYRNKIDRVFQGLGFSADDAKRPIDSFSGGEQARIMLGQLLLDEPDLMLLDEPTNHLDIDAVEYLEGYLEEFKGGVMIISHDRYFLNRVATTIVDIAWQRGEIYRGNYTFYRREKENRTAIQHKHFKLQRDRIDKLEDYIRRNMAAQKTKQAQSRLKELERIDRLEDVRGPAKQMNLRLAMKRASGQILFETRNIGKGFDGEFLFRDVNLRIHRGEIVGIIGPNGSGKTTLLRILADETVPDDGELIWGHHVHSAYYNQHLNDLNEQNDIISEVWNVIPGMTQQEVRDHLGRFLFSGDDVFKIIGPLSGGEKSRVALAKLFLKDANLLILDEPTNHLDLPARESLESALMEYPGTVVMVTHDRYLLDRIADRIWTLEDKTFIEYPGNYSDYKHLKALA